MVNKLRATDQSISPGLIYKVRHSIYLSVPWFWFSHIDLAFRVLWYNWNFLSQLELLKSTNAIKHCPGIIAVSTVNIPKPRRSCSWTNKINKLLVSPNERSNSITLEYYSASNFHGKRIQRYPFNRKDLAYSSAHKFVTSYHMSPLRYHFTSRDHS